MPDPTDVPLDILIHRAAGARAAMRVANRLADEANTRFSNASVVFEAAEKAVRDRIAAEMHASDQAAADSQRDAIEARLGAIPAHHRPGEGQIV